MRLLPLLVLLTAGATWGATPRQNLVQNPSLEEFYGGRTVGIFSLQV